MRRSDLFGLLFAASLFAAILFAAIFVIAAILTMAERALAERDDYETFEIVGYDRSAWSHWSDEDGDCYDTRQETLQRLGSEVFAEGCRVYTGRWLDPYSGRIYTDPHKLDIDHIVPLKEAHESGGSEWDGLRRAAFANDPLNLLAVSAKENRSKGSRDPARWMPSNEDFHCEYVRRWIEVKRKYDLSLDLAEAEVVILEAEKCSSAAAAEGAVDIEDSRFLYPPRFDHLNPLGIEEIGPAKLHLLPEGEGLKWEIIDRWEKVE